MLAALIGCGAATGAFAESPGFPVDLGAAPVGSPRVLDLDGDEDDDVIAATRDGRLFVFARHGTRFEQSPVDLSAEVGRAVTLSIPPAFGDLDGSGTPEVVIATDDGALVVLSSDLSLRFVVELGPDALVATAVAQSASGARLLVLSAGGALHVLDGAGEELAGSPLLLPTGTWAPGLAVADVDNDGALDVALASVGGDGHAAATLVSLAGAPAVANGWPVELGVAATVAPPVIADFDSNGTPELVFGAQGLLPVVLRASGDPAIELSDVLTQSTLPTLFAVADLDGDERSELLCAVDGGWAAFAVGAQLQRNAMFTPQPAPVRDGFPITAVLASGAGLAVADVTGDNERDLIVADGLALQVVSKRGAAEVGWPQAVNATLVGAPAVGAQRDVMVIAAVSEDGELHLWDGLGQPHDLQWDGFQHDPGNTGALMTPLPPRTVHPIGGGGGGPEPDEQGCCQGSIAGFELGMWAGLLVLARLRLRSRPRSRPRSRLRGRLRGR